MASRISLLLLLPVFVAALYFDGQRYDPETLEFARTPGEKLLRYLPESVAELTRDREVRFFNKDNLFEHVNGHAEFYLSAGFESVAVATYRMEGDPPGTPSVTVDFFDMGSPENAFGVMAEEGEGAKPINIGRFGVKTRQTILFVSGRYYVKVVAFIKRYRPVNLAKAVAKNIGDSGDDLPQFARFPEEGADLAMRGYILRDYMGHEILTGVFEQKYRRGDAEFTAFLFKPKEGGVSFAKNAKSYFSNLDIEVAPVMRDGMTVYDVKDPYEPWSFVIDGDYILGVTEIEKLEGRVDYLSEVYKKKAGSK